MRAIVYPHLVRRSLEKEVTKLAERVESERERAEQAEVHLEQAREEEIRLGRFLHEAVRERDALAGALREMMGSYTSLVQLAKHNPDRLVREVFTGDPMMWDGPICARSALTALEPKRATR